MKLLLLAIFFSSTSAIADGHCKDKKVEKKKAHEAVNKCVKSWGKDLKANAPDPSEDCSAKMYSFVEASRNLKACLGEKK
jgi:hypothetical protein